MPLLIQVSLHYRPIGGGQEVYIETLSRVVAAAGWETKVIQPYRGVTAPDTLTVPRLPGIARFLPAFDELQIALLAVARRSRWLDRADIILCHYAATAALIGRIRRWRPKTLVLSHGVEWNVDRMNRHDRLREWNARRLFERVPTVANDTDYLRRMGLSLMPGKGSFSEVAPGVWFIPNGVDPVHFSPGPSPRVRDPNRPVILVPRQICEDRGIHLAIEAFALLAQRHPDARLSVVGHRRERTYFEQCRRLVERHGLGDRVQFSLPVPNRDMAGLYRTADVTLIPTLRREGTSLSALESMACGTPVVASDVAGLRDLPAFRAEPAPAALAGGLEAVLSDWPVEADRQRRAACGEFGLEIWSAAWMRVLTTLRNRRQV